MGNKRPKERKAKAELARRRPELMRRRAELKVQRQMEGLEAGKNTAALREAIDAAIKAGHRVVRIRPDGGIEIKKEPCPSGEPEEQGQV
jgi:hypothetical protein